LPAPPARPAGDAWSRRSTFLGLCLILALPLLGLAGFHAYQAQAAAQVAEARPLVHDFMDFRGELPAVPEPDRLVNGRRLPLWVECPRCRGARMLPVAYGFGSRTLVACPLCRGQGAVPNPEFLPHYLH